MIGKLEMLYPGRGEEVLRAISKLVDDFRERNPDRRVGSCAFSEKDVVLICYPDHVQEGGNPKLATLRKFLGEFGQEFSHVHVLPHYPEAGDEGFSVMDHFSVREDLGTWKDVRDLAQDYSLMLDLVLNHMSDKSGWFQRFLAGDKEVKDFFIAYDKEPDLSSVFRPRTDPLLKPYRFGDESEKLVWSTFPLNQVDINYGNPKVLVEMARALLHYVENGAKAVRLDAIAYAWKKLGTSCFNLKESHTIVEVFREVLREAAPDVWVITETVIDHEENMSYLGKEKAHLAYHFVLEPLLYLTFLKGNSERMARYLREMPVPDGKDTALLNLSVSHDGIHAVPAKGILNEEDFKLLEKDCKGKGCGVMYRTAPGKEPEHYEFNTCCLDAIGRPDAFLASQAIKLALPGIPLVYFNNYFGCRNWLEGIEKVGYPRAANRERFDYGTLSKRLRKEDSESGFIHRNYSSMLKKRTSEPLFSPSAGFEALDLGPDVVGFTRSRNGRNLMVLVNVTDNETRAEIPKGTLGERARDILTGEEFDAAKPVSLGPHEYLWLK